MYPRQQLPYSPYPPSNQAYPAVYFTQTAQIYPYNNYPGKMGPISYAHDSNPMMTTAANPPPVTAQIPPQPDNLYINYQQPQQQIISQQSLPQQQLSQQQLPQQHIQQQLQQQQQRQYELSHQIGQIPQVPVVKPRPMSEQYIGQPIKNKPKTLYQTPIPPSPQIPKQMIQTTQQRSQLQPIMIAPQQIPQPQPRQYTPLPQKPQIIQQPIEPQTNNQQYKFKQEDNSTSLSHKMSFAIQDNEPPGCFDIIGRGNLPSIYFNTSISLS